MIASVAGMISTAGAPLHVFRKVTTMNRIARTNPLTAEEEEREALTADDYIAAGVDVPNWADDPIPTLETWRRWQAAQNKALAHKRAVSRS